MYVTIKERRDRLRQKVIAKELLPRLRSEQATDMQAINELYAEVCRLRSRKAAVDKLIELYV